MTSIYDQDLPRNEANFAPISPLSFIERTAEVYPNRLAIVHGLGEQALRQTWAETYARCRRLASALQRVGRAAAQAAEAGGQCQQRRRHIRRRAFRQQRGEGRRRPLVRARPASSDGQRKRRVAQRIRQRRDIRIRRVALRAGLRLEHLPRHARRRGSGGEVQPPGIGARIGDEIRNAPHRQCWIHHKP